MKRLKDIRLTKVQLGRLLSREQLNIYNLILGDNVFCVRCNDAAKEGIVVEEITLNYLNDIMVRGTCNICKGKVARIFEFGEDKEFFKRATDFRNSLL